MAELTLKTRLLNKMSADHVDGLLKGEINFYPITVDVADQKQETYLVMEVGGTDKPFAAKASDVYEWAKAPTKPTYKAGEIEDLDSHIGTIAQDTNTTYTFTIKEATGELEIISHEINGTSTTVGTFDVVSHDELEARLADCVEALKNYVLIDDFNAFKETVNAEAIADAKKAGTDAAAALEAYKTANNTALANVKATADAAAVKTEVETALAGKVDVVEGKSLVDNTEIARLATLVNYDDTAIKADIKDNADAIDAIKADYLKAADKTELSNAISAEASRADAAEKKALADAKVYADGLVSAEASRADAAIEAAENAAKAYADGIKSDLLGEGAISETYDTLKEIADWITTSGVDATDLSSAIAAEAKAREEADTALDEKITAEATARDAADVALGERIDAVSAIANDAQTANEVASAIDTKIAALKAEDLWDGKGAADAALEVAKADATTKANAAEAAAKAYADANDKDTTYTAGAGLKLDGTVFSIDTDLVFILDANA